MDTLIIFIALIAIITGSAVMGYMGALIYEAKVEHKNSREAKK